MFGSHQKLVDTVNNLERAARFAANEAVLRNRIVRLAIKLEGEEQTFTVQYGPDSSFVLPVQYLTDTPEAGLLDEDQLAAKRKEVEKAFQNVQEFQEGPLEIEDLVTVVGAATSLTNSLQLSGQVSLFFYPSGEKDGAIIILGTEEEMATFEIAPFTMDFERNFYEIDGDTGDILEFQINKAKSFYEEWLK